MYPAPINRRGPINRNPAAVKTNSFPSPSNTGAKSPTGTKAPPTVRYNTLTAERIIATWKVTRGPTADLNDTFGKNTIRANLEVRNRVAKTTTTTTNRQVNTAKSSAEVQKQVIETWKEKRTVPKTAAAVTPTKKEITKTNQVSRSGSVRNAAKKPAEENKKDDQALESQVRSVLKTFEKNVTQRQVKLMTGKTAQVKKEEPKPAVKVVPEPVKKEEAKPKNQKEPKEEAKPKNQKEEPKPKEEAKPAKKVEKIVVPIKKPSINVTVQPWAPDKRKDIITSSVRPSLKKAESKDKIGKSENKRIRLTITLDFKAKNI